MDEPKSNVESLYALNGNVRESVMRGDRNAWVKGRP